MEDNVEPVAPLEGKRSREASGGITDKWRIYVLRAHSQVQALAGVVLVAASSLFCAGLVEALLRVSRASGSQTAVVTGVQIASAIAVGGAAVFAVGSWKEQQRAQRVSQALVDLLDSINGLPDLLARMRHPSQGFTAAMRYAERETGKRAFSLEFLITDMGKLLMRRLESMNAQFAQFERRYWNAVSMLGIDSKKELGPVRECIREAREACTAFLDAEKMGSLPADRQAEVKQVAIADLSNDPFADRAAEAFERAIRYLEEQL